MLQSQGWGREVGAETVTRSCRVSEYRSSEFTLNVMESLEGGRKACD